MYETEYSIIHVMKHNIIRQTEKAIELAGMGWLPKSQIKWDTDSKGNLYVILPEWLWKKLYQPERNGKIPASKINEAITDLSEKVYSGELFIDHEWVDGKFTRSITPTPTPEPSEETVTEVISEKILAEKIATAFHKQGWVNETLKMTGFRISGLERKHFQYQQIWNALQQQKSRPNGLQELSATVSDAIEKIQHENAPKEWTWEVIQEVFETARETIPHHSLETPVQQRLDEWALDGWSWTWEQ